MATQTDNEAENAERPRNGVFKVVRRRGDKKKSARRWLFYGVSSRKLAHYRSERESGLTNATLLEHARCIKGPPRFDAIVCGIIALILIFVRQGPDTAILWFGLMGCVYFLMYGQRNSIGAKAAALLAERGDKRAFPLLARLWEVNGKTPFLTETGERRFERWLAEEFAGMPSDAPRDLRGMVRRAFPFRRRFQYADFSDAATDTLLAALRCLAQHPYNENKAILRHVARFPLPPNAPNRALLREMAILFLDDPKPAVPLQRPATAAVLPTPSILPTAIAPPVSPEIAEQTVALNRRI